MINQNLGLPLGWLRAGSGFCRSTDFQGTSVSLGSMSAAGKAVTFPSLINTSPQLSLRLSGDLD